MLLRTLQRGELTGGKGWPRSCLDLPAAFLERLDAPERVGRGEKPREAMPALLRQLEQHILQQERRVRGLEAAVAEREAELARAEALAPPLLPPGQETTRAKPRCRARATVF